MTARQTRLQLLRNQLSALGPRQALERGYAVVLSGRDAVTSVSQVKDEMSLLMRDGRVRERGSGGTERLLPGEHADPGQARRRNP